jgi:chaperone modulatory protein CbpM
MNDPVSAVPLDDSIQISLAELCSTCRVSEDIIVEIVAEGIVEPSGAEPAEWQFSGLALARIRRALRLQHDFGVNMPGVALALDLLDELERLRRRR